MFTRAAHNPSQLVSIFAIGDRIMRGCGADECRCLPRKRRVENSVQGQSGQTGGGGTSGNLNLCDSVR